MTISNRRDRCALLMGGAALAVIASALASGASAQTVPTPPQEDEAATVEDIVVTGGKRPENVQDVPQSVLVVTAAGLERANVRDFDDIVRVAPSVTITKTSQPANNSINIRGIGTYAYSIATEASVAVVIDDIPQAFQAAAFSALVDVQQVEVLRGPQNTLFGKSASAGVINITTQPVSPTFTARMETLFTDDHESRVQATVSGPITDTLGFRLAGNYSDYRGNIYNISTGNWLNGTEDATLRGKLVWTPGDDWTVTLSPYVTRTRASCCVGAETFVAAGSTTGGAATGVSRIPMSVFLAGITPGPDNRVTRMDVDGQGNALDAGSGLKIERQWNGFTFASITSYDKYNLDDLQDTDSTDINFALYQPASPAGGSANGGYFDIYSTTQEFRLTSPGGERLTYVAGAYYSDTRSRRYFVRGSNTLDDYSTATPPGAPGVPATPASLPTTNGTAYSRYLSTARSQNYAIYGQGSFSVTDQFDILAGLRVNKEEISYVFYDLGNGVTFGAPKCSTTTPSGTPIQTCNDDTSVTGRFGVRYRFTPDIMGFATYSRGYKGMAYDLTSTLTTRTAAPATSLYPGRPLADVVAANQPVPPETVDSYEIGIKTSLLDNRITLNLTAFNMIFNGFQAQSRDLLLNQNLLNSIGEVTSRGVEAEMAARFGPLTLNGGLAWNKAIMEEFPNASCYQGQTVAEGCVAGAQNLSGKPLFNAPEWNVNLNAQYDVPITDTLTGFVTGSYRWQSEVVYNLLQDPDSIQDAYGIFNLAVGVRNDQWKLTGFVNNLFDKSYALTKGRDAFINNPAGVFATNWKPARDSQRYFGVRLAVSY
jgi:iron complex outermembrane receptor protein